MRSDINRAHGLPARRVEGVQRVAGGKPDVLAVKGDAMLLVDARKRSIFAKDFGYCSIHVVDPSQSATERGVTRSSRNSARSASSSDELVRGRTIALCPLRQALRAHAARCADWLRARSPAPSSTTIHHRSETQEWAHALLHVCRSWAAPARPLHAHDAATAQILASSRSRGRAAEAPCEAGRFQLAIARDASRRRVSLRTPARRVFASAHRRATPRPVHVRGQTAQDVLQAGPPYARYVRHNGMRRRQALSTPATVRHLRAEGAVPRHSRSHAPQVCSEVAMRFPPLRPTQGFVHRAPSARRGPAPLARRSLGGVASPPPPRSGRARLALRTAPAPQRVLPRHARPHP